MKKNILIFTLPVLLAFLSPNLFSEEAVGIEGLFEERIRSVVAVEFFVETEIDRQPSSDLGIVADDAGLIVLQDQAIPAWVPFEQLKQFKVRLLYGREEFDATYLGQETLNGWHFLRVGETRFQESVVPVTSYPVAEVQLGEELWGFGVMDDDYDYEPYYLSTSFSLLRELPVPIGFTMTPVTSPGSLVFNKKGDLVGWGAPSYLTDVAFYFHEERIPAALQTTRASGAFLPARAFLPFLDKVPEDPKVFRIPWAGAIQLQPVEREVAKFMEIDDQGAVVLSQIIEKSPMAEAGMEKGDVVIAVDGKPIPYFRPHVAVTDYLQREVLRREIGDKMEFTVLRGSGTIEFEVTLGQRPPTLREAERHYFRDLGITIREFLLFDGVARRSGIETDQGVIAQFIRPNSPAATAGLHPNDWIKEVDGVEITEYSQAIELITEAMESERNEIVFLTSRQNETSVIRVRIR